MMVAVGCIDAWEKRPRVSKTWTWLNTSPILCNLRELYRFFKEIYPHEQIGFSKFAEFRPSALSLFVCALYTRMKLEVPFIYCNTTKPFFDQCKSSLKPGELVVYVGIFQKTMLLFFKMLLKETTLRQLSILLLLISENQTPVDKSPKFCCDLWMPAPWYTVNSGYYAHIIS